MAPPKAQDAEPGADTPDAPEPGAASDPVPRLHAVADTDPAAGAEVAQDALVASNGVAAPGPADAAEVTASAVEAGAAIDGAPIAGSLAGEHESAPPDLDPSMETMPTAGAATDAAQDAGVSPAAEGETGAGAEGARPASEATSEEAASRAVTALRAAVMPLQQLAERGDLRPTLTMAASTEPPPVAPAAEPAQPPTLHAQIVVPDAATIEATVPAAGSDDFRGAAWPDEPPRAARREWAGPFFVGLGAVAVVAFAAMAFVGWSSSKPAVQASKRPEQPSLASTTKASSPAVDAAADAAAEAAARLLANTPERATRKPDGRTTPDPVAATSPAAAARPPTREAPPPRPAVVAQARPPAAAPAAPSNPMSAAPRPPLVPAVSAGPGTPVPQATEATRPRAIAPTPPPALPRECTAAMDALGLCQTGSKPSGS